MIPQILLDLAGSKKAITFWVIIALWMPSVHRELGLSETALIRCTVAFCAYVISQGLADLGRGDGHNDSPCSRIKKEIK